MPKLSRENLIAVLLCLFVLAIIILGTNASTNFIYAGF
jgi:hypothetical protein